MAKVTRKRKPNRSPSKKESPKQRRPIVPALFFLLIISSLIASLYLYNKYSGSVLRIHKKTETQPTNNSVNLPKTKPTQEKERLKQSQQSPVRVSQPTTLNFYRLEQNLSRPIELKKNFDRTLSKQQKAREIIHLLSFSRERDLAPLPLHTKLLAITFTAPLITIDLSKDLSKGAVNFGGRDEMLAISCLTNSFLENFPNYAALQIIIEGEKQVTLAGHIDISQPIYYQPSIKD